MFESSENVIIELNDNLSWKCYRHVYYMLKYQKFQKSYACGQHQRFFYYGVTHWKLFVVITHTNTFQESNQPKLSIFLEKARYDRETQNYQTRKNRGMLYLFLFCHIFVPTKKAEFLILIFSQSMKESKRW